MTYRDRIKDGLPYRHAVRVVRVPCTHYFLTLLYFLMEIRHCLFYLPIR